MEKEPTLPIVIQKWKGYVTEVEEKVFWAVLSPLIGEGPDQIAEILVEKVDSKYRDRIQVGASFYWTIGYASKEDFDAEKGSSLVWFLEPIIFTEEMAEKSKERAKRLWELWNGDETKDPKKSD